MFVIDIFCLEFYLKSKCSTFTLGTFYGYTGVIVRGRLEAGHAVSVNLTCDQLKKDEDNTESAPMYGRG